MKCEILLLTNQWQTGYSLRLLTSFDGNRICYDWWRSEVL